MSAIDRILNLCLVVFWSGDSRRFDSCQTGNTSRLRRLTGSVLNQSAFFCDRRKKHVVSDRLFYLISVIAIQSWPSTLSGEALVTLRVAL